jgi:hypothetical protein
VAAKPRSMADPIRLFVFDAHHKGSAARRAAMIVRRVALRLIRRRRARVTRSTSNAGSR